MVLPDSDGISRVPPYSGYIQENEVSTTGLLPSTTLSRSLRLPRSFVTPYRMSSTPRGKPLGLICSVSLAATLAFAFFLQVLRCFSSLGLSSLPYSDKDTIPYGGFPHSEIFGSLTYSSRSISALVPSFIDS